MPRTRKLVSPASPGEEIGRAVQELFDNTLCHEMDIHISMDNQYISYDLKDCRLTVPLTPPPTSMELQLQAQQKREEDMREYLEKCVIGAFIKPFDFLNDILEGMRDFTKHEGRHPNTVALNQRMFDLLRDNTVGRQLNTVWGMIPTVDDTLVDYNWMLSCDERPLPIGSQKKDIHAREGQCSSISPVSKLRCNGSKGHKGPHHCFDMEWKDDPQDLQKEVRNDGPTL